MDRVKQSEIDAEAKNRALAASKQVRIGEGGGEGEKSLKTAILEDRELLELAAKACGYDTSHPVNSERLNTWPPRVELYIAAEGRAINPFWNPLADDADALRLAVKLGLSIKHGVEALDETGGMSALAYYGNVGECESEHHGDDPERSTRRAIVRAAAEIGRAMP